MSTALVNPSFDLIGTRSGRTPFERNILPGFTEWFIERLDADGPDFLVPVETRGARLVEAALEYARRELGTRVRVPVLYGSALSYLSPAELSTSRIMIIDDAVRSGRTLARHRERVERYGVRDVRAVACIRHVEHASAVTTNGDGERARDHRRELGGVSSYRVVSAGVYRDYVWQSAELVVARGLPPEVDHHVFELQAPGRLAAAWEDIGEALRQFGTLTVDGPLTTHEDIVSMTLHFPRLPSMLRYPTSGPVRDEGVKKVRLFADLSKGVIYVVPMAFPALDLPAGSSDGLSSAQARTVLDHWTGGRSSIGDVLVDEAEALDADVLFRAVATTAEMDLVCGLMDALADAGLSDLELRAQSGLFDRLYGVRAGERVAASVDEVLRRARATRAQHPGLQPTAARSLGQHGVLRLDEHVRDTTKLVANYLKTIYQERTRDPDFDPVERVGLSFSELLRDVPPGDLSRLLLSRSIDFGLAMTTLVPYTAVARKEDGSVHVRRKYRVSELNRGDEPYQDVDMVRQQVDEETVALIARYLRNHSDSYRDRPIPPSHVACLVAVLRRLALERHEITLRTRATQSGPDIVLGSLARPSSIYEVTSAFFTLRGGGVSPTRLFEECYDEDKLQLDRRQDAEAIEAYLEEIVPVLDDAEDAERLLFCWALSTDERLGLTSVEHDLRAALTELEGPLNIVGRGDIPDAGSLLQACERAEELVSDGRRKLDALTSGWATPLRERWSKPRKMEMRLARSLATPAEPDTVFALPRALCVVIEALARLVRQLEFCTVSGGQERDGWPDVEDALAADLTRQCNAIERRLTTCEEEGAVPPVPEGSEERAKFVADQLLRTSALVRAFVAAVAWLYRGLARERPPVELEGPRLATILFADLSKSFEHAAEANFEANHQWKDSGLNLIAQWGKAFGGREIRDRGGDDIWLQFENADSAALCAAAVQEHARALRSTRVESVHWSFHLAVDTGQIAAGDGGNVIGSCIDRSAKLAKRLDDEILLERVLVTPETANACSHSLRSQLAGWDQEVELAKRGTGAEIARFTPLTLEPVKAVQRVVEQVVGEADTIIASYPLPSHQTLSETVAEQEERADAAGEN